MPEHTESDFAQLLQSIQTSAGINVVLWLLSSFGWIGLVVWCLWGGSAAEVKARVEAIEKLWPLILTWSGSLVLKSQVTGNQKREMIRTNATLRALKLSPGATVVGGAAGGP